ncbi:Holliday junction resolvase RuvX [Buchnera aphidicola]|uniref:Holliday junction resolvase RuvX n=1 Tax=Buchnera aphidicola TaxID=9 RepID=UPI0031B7EE50
MIILAFDYGTKKIGVAIGQKITKTARPLKKITFKNNKIKWIKISKLINEWKPKKIIIGLPLTLKGKKQNITIITKNFAKKIKKKYNIKIILHNEILTTKLAKSYLLKKKKKKYLKNDIDSIAAVFILESWFKKKYNIL